MAKTGVVTEGVVVTVCVAVLGPPQPVAVAVIIEVPVQPTTKVTAPLVVLIVLPPVKLAASRLYEIPVEFVEVAE